MGRGWRLSLKRSNGGGGWYCRAQRRNWCRRGRRCRWAVGVRDCQHTKGPWSRQSTSKRTPNGIFACEACLRAPVLQNCSERILVAGVNVASNSTKRAAVKRRRDTGGVLVAENESGSRKSSVQVKLPEEVVVSHDVSRSDGIPSRYPGVTTTVKDWVGK